MTKLSCFYCIYANIHPGEPQTYWEPGEAAHLEECRNQKVNDSIFDEVYDDDRNDEPEEILASVCGGFEPKLIEKCRLCKKKMNVPEYIWKVFYIDEYDNVPACSEECKIAYEVAYKLTNNEEVY